METLKNDNILTEEELEQMSGGKDDYAPPNDSKCFFTPTGQTEIRTPIVGISKLWAECNSVCFGCGCRFKDHCVQKWHLLDIVTNELSPENFSNHKDKPKNNGYNTK